MGAEGTMQNKIKYLAYLENKGIPTGMDNFIERSSKPDYMF
jgi:hypothetical protein